MSDTRTENDAILEAGRDQTDAHSRVVEVDGIPVGITNNGGLEVLHDVIQIANQRMPRPRRRRGHTRHTTLDSLITYTATYGGSDTCIWASRDAGTITAIYDYHAAGPDKAGWAQDRATYDCPVDPRWEFWGRACEVPHTQDGFGDLIDENLEDLVELDGGPKPLDVLELSRSLRVDIAESYERKINPATGEYNLVAKMERGASSTAIPRAFGLAIPVFVGGPKYMVECRIKLRMTKGQPRFDLTLHREREIHDRAFADVVETVEKRTGRRVFAGDPGVPHDAV